MSRRLRVHIWFHANILALLGFLLSVSSFDLNAQSRCSHSDHVWTRTVQGCEICADISNFSLSWSGPCVEGKAQGTGELRWQTQDGRLVWFRRFGPDTAFEMKASNPSIAWERVAFVTRYFNSVMATYPTSVCEVRHSEGIGESYSLPMVVIYVDDSLEIADNALVTALVAKHFHGTLQKECSNIARATDFAKKVQDRTASPLALPPEVRYYILPVPKANLQGEGPTFLPGNRDAVVCKVMLHQELGAPLCADLRNPFGARKEQQVRDMQRGEMEAARRRQELAMEEQRKVEQARQQEDTRRREEAMRTELQQAEASTVAAFSKNDTIIPNLADFISYDQARALVELSKGRKIQLPVGDPRLEAGKLVLTATVTTSKAQIAAKYRTNAFPGWGAVISGATANPMANWIVVYCLVDLPRASALKKGTTQTFQARAKHFQNNELRLECVPGS